MLTHQQILRMGVWLAFVNCCVPLLAVVGAYAVGLQQGVVPVCNPFWEGCLTISRAARSGDAIFWFRGLMLPLVPVYAVFWTLLVYWLKRKTGRHSHEMHVILWLGYLSAVALLFYVNFLGTEGAVYGFMRRQGVMLYFGFAGLAQLYSLHVLSKYRPALTSQERFWVRWQWGFVLGQWVLGLTSVIATAWQPEHEDRIRNAIEWQFATLMVAFYGFSGLLWRLDTRSSQRQESEPVV